MEKVDIIDMIGSTKDLIVPYVGKDPTKFCTDEEFEKAVEALEQFCPCTLNLSDMGSMDHSFFGKDREDTGRM